MGAAQLALAGAFDTFQAQLAPQSVQERLPRVVDLLPGWAWYMWVSVLLLVRLVIMLESAYHKVKVYEQRRRVPRNRDGLIAAFTDLAARAARLARAKSAIRTVLRNMEHPVPNHLYQDIKKGVDRARDALEEAEIAVDREVNIAGGDFSRFLQFCKLVIASAHWKLDIDIEDQDDADTYSEVCEEIRDRAEEAINATRVLDYRYLIGE